MKRTLFFSAFSGVAVSIIGVSLLGSPFLLTQANANPLGIDFTPGRYQNTSSKNSYDVKRKIGAGNFGDVYLGKAVNGDFKNRPVAVKFYKKNEHVSINSMLQAFVKAKEICPLLCPQGLHEIIDVGSFVSSFKLGPVKGVVSELGVGDGKILRPFLSLVDSASNDLAEFASRIEFASALFQYMSDFQIKLAEQNLALNDIKPENFIVSMDNRLLFADFDTLHSLGKTPKIFTLLNAAPEQFKELSTATTDLFLIANTILDYISGTILIEHIRNTTPGTRQGQFNPNVQGQNYIFSYGLIEAQDPKFVRTLDPFFTKVLKNFQENVAKELSSNGPDSELNASAKDTVAHANHLFEGLRSALQMKSDQRQHYTDERFGSMSPKKPATQVVSDYLGKIAAFEASCQQSPKKR